MLFSVVIPTYNRAALLAEALASVRAQTFADWECIVVDDGSTDHTRGVVAAVAVEDPRVRYVHQANAERSAARNHGIRVARGEYLCFLDSDDRYAPEYLHRLARFVADRGSPRALIVSAYQLWDGERAVAVEVSPLGGNPATWLFEQPVQPSRVCLHREITGRFRFREDITVVEDSVLWVSVATVHPVLWQPEPLVWYRVHAGNSVSRASRSAFARHDGLRRFFSDPLSAAVPPGLKRALLSDVRFRMAEWHAQEGHRIRALLTIAWSILGCPFHVHTRAKLFFVLGQVPGFLVAWRRFRPLS